MSGTDMTGYAAIYRALAVRYQVLTKHELDQIHRRWTVIGKKAKATAGLIGQKY